MSDKKTLEYANEDTVQCFIFSSSCHADDTAFWEQRCEQVNNTIQSLSTNYIWHRDEFKLHLPIIKETDNIPTHLIGTTCFGDNLEDEWFIVYLVLEITKQFEDLIVKIQDNDGDFILIEAADYLPSWANPDCTENRVFIYQNHIHILPPTVVDINSELSLQEGLEFVIEHKDKTKVPEIQQAILKRIGHYPDKIEENIHRAIVKLPLDVASLLILKPSLISPLVSAYCNHDVIDAKVCKKTSFENCVTVQVKFTKCLYAMLVHAKLIRNIKYLMKNDKKSVLGLKLTYGYEIITNKTSEDIFSSSDFKKYKKILDESGYFKHYIEDSYNYTELLNKAKEYFLSTECPVNSHVCNNILQLMSTNEFIQLKEKLKNTYIHEADLVEDNEDWLNIHPEQLNDLLNERYGRQSKLKNDDIITPQTITSELTNFLNKTSDFEGIETGPIGEAEDNIEFDSEEFVNTLKNMLSLISSDNPPDPERQSDLSDDMDEDMSQDDDQDNELREKLRTDENDVSNDSRNILRNMIKSMKEEEGSSGPSSNILRTVGFNKADLLDSDDDE